MIKKKTLDPTTIRKATFDTITIRKKRHLTQLVKDGELAKRLQCAYSFEIFKKISLRIMIYDRPSSIGTHWEVLWFEHHEL